MAQEKQEKVWTLNFIIGIVGIFLGILVSILASIYQTYLIRIKDKVAETSSFYSLMVILLLFIISSYLIINNKKWRPKTKSILRLINHIWSTSLGFVIFLILDKEIIKILIVNNTDEQSVNSAECLMYIIIMFLIAVLINLSCFCFYKIRELKTF